MHGNYERQSANNYRGQNNRCLRYNGQRRNDYRRCYGCLMPLNSVLNSVCSDCNLVNCDYVLVNPNCSNSDSDSRPEDLGYNFSINENTHVSSHLIQQTSSCNTETHSGSKDESYLNLNLSNKGINIGFLNVQGLCSREMTKFSEIELFLTAEKNKHIHTFGMCETKLKKHKPTSAFQINGFQLPF